MAKWAIGLKGSKREGVLRLTLFIVLTSLIYTVREYSWAIVLVSLVAVYFLITGAYQYLYSPRNE
ncbi:hypothetical protein [Paenibacillus sp. sgz500958]|uniref:hypothetical protein n=1 Tax=Paenibacillus sp. sgz500958 TaxID=3242475 RepID=UPI0036D34660